MPQTTSWASKEGRKGCHLVVSSTVHDTQHRQPQCSSEPPCLFLWMHPSLRRRLFDLGVIGNKGKRLLLLLCLAPLRPCVFNQHIGALQNNRDDGLSCFCFVSWPSIHGNRPYSTQEEVAFWGEEGAQHLCTQEGEFWHTLALRTYQNCVRTC